MLKQRDEQDCAELQIVHSQHPAYGYRRLGLVLGWCPSKTRRIMKVAGVTPLAMRKKRFAYGLHATTTDASDKLPEELRENLLKKHNIVANYPNHVWAEDFTYLKYQNKMYYLATVLDLYSRQITGWALSAHHDTDLIQLALLDAVGKHQSPKILHNDQGTEYCSKKYYALCEVLKIRMSFSAKASPWQNPFQESFYREFKLELGVKHLDRFGCLGEVTEAIARQLHYYNNIRIHTSLQTNPAAYAARFEDSTKEDVVEGLKSQCKARKIDVNTEQIATGVRDRVLQKVGA